MKSLLPAFIFGAFQQYAVHFWSFVLKWSLKIMFNAIVFLYERKKFYYFWYYSLGT